MNQAATPSRGLARNAISNWTAFLYVAGVSFFLSPFIVKHLGATQYGVWSLLVALVGYLGLLDFGVRGAVTRYIAKHHAISDTKSASSIASGALVLFGFAGVVAILLAIGLALLSPLLFNIPPELAGTAKVVLIVGGFTVASTLVSAVFGGIVTGLERFDISSGIEILITTVRTIGVIAALEDGHGLPALAYVHLATSLAYGLLAWFAVRRIYPNLKFDFSQPLRGPIKTILSFSAFLSIIHVLAMVIYYTDALVIAVILPISAVAIFAIAGNLCEYASKVAGALSKMMTPRVSALTSIGAPDIGEAVLSTARLATLASTPIAMTFFFRGESFISLWMGPEFGPASGAVLRVMAIVVWLGGARAVASSAVIGANRHRTLIPALAAEALANLGLSIVLAHLIGVVGVAWGSAIPSVIVALAYVPLCLKWATGVAPSTYYRQAWLLPTVACLPFLIATVCFEHFLPARNLLMFFLQVILIVPLVPGAALLVCATREERQNVISLARRFYAGAN
jgi:O-antigen/teichoic acid export membrane protein